ncbi:F-box/kelch-repeat protein At3g06240-like [Apium graveolens]|uniref:F-box/kelch-repeat protein At3g06240-like n=1 Tax=Apium graveolens TaxID=4045 RepID=UPI003D7BF158
MPNGEHYSDHKLDLESLSLYSLLNEPDTEIIKHDRDFDDYDDYWGDITQVVGYDNGLVCLASKRGDVFLWNPSTGESNGLPDLIPESKYFLAFGFCYDELNDDYKVFSICDRYKVSVYSLKNDELRMIADFPYEIRSYHIYYKGMFANEAMHWACRPVGRESKIIVALDIKTETFGEVLPPIYGEGECRWLLGTFGTSLSFCRFDSTYADFWVMKYGTEESWTKLFTIPYVDGPKDQFSSEDLLYPNIDREANLIRPTELSFLKPINITVNGEIIMMLNSHIQLYNPKDSIYKELFDRGECYEYHRDTGPFIFTRGFNCDVNAYVESLISPYL